MTDIKIKEQPFSVIDGPTWDWFMTDIGELDEREEFATSVRVALGTDALADPSDILPDPDSTDRRGWWGDLDAEEIWDGWPIGTKNWLLTRAKITGVASSEGSTLERARQYTLSAVQPFVDKMAGSRVSVVAKKTALDRIEVEVVIYRGPLSEINLRWQILWEESALPMGARPEEEVFDVFPRPKATNLTITSQAPTVSMEDLEPSIVHMYSSNLVLTTYAPQSVVTTLMTPASADLILSSTAPVWIDTELVPDGSDLLLSTTIPIIELTESAFLTAADLTVGSPDIGAGLQELMIPTQITAGWTGSGVTITADVADGPNGPNTADRVRESNVFAQHYVFTNQAMSVETGSTLVMWADVKPDGRDQCRLVMTGNRYCRFNVATGTIVDHLNTISRSIEAIGNGYYRCSMTSLAVQSSVAAYFMLYAGGDAYDGDGVSGVLVGNVGIALSLPNPLLAQQHVLAASSLVTSSPVLGAPSITIP